MDKISIYYNDPFYHYGWVNHTKNWIKFLPNWKLKILSYTMFEKNLSDLSFKEIHE